MVDGVNVVNGKRIAELRVLDEDDPYHSSNFDNSYYYLTDKVYRIEYDTKGRLFKIICGLVVVAQFDYDLKTINLLGTNYIFSLNNSGYISQIGSYVINYDSNGYFIGVEHPYGKSSLVYEGNKLTKALTENYNANRTTSYYIRSGQDITNGNLLFFINKSSPVKRLFQEESGYTAKVISLIAYQTGLLGKIAKQCLELKEMNETSVIGDYHAENKDEEFRFTFVWEDINDKRDHSRDHFVTDMIFFKSGTGIYNWRYGWVEATNYLGFENRSSESVTLTGIYVMNPVTEYESHNFLIANKEVAAGETYDFSIKYQGSMNEVKIRCEYYYNNKRYSIEKDNLIP